jgi:hypothetical protein
MKKILCSTFVLASLCFLTLPIEAYASHDGGRESSYSQAIDELDKDEVEEFAIPVLFGIT